MKKLVVFFSFIFVVILLHKISTPVFADEYIQDNGFEEDSLSWHTTNSNVIFQLDTKHFFEGTQSAQITNPSGNSYGIEQVVPNLLPDISYMIAGFAQIGESVPTKTILRVAWYASTDGSGSQLKTDDSNSFTSISDWNLLQIIAKAPINAHSAKLRILVSQGTAYIDSLSMLEYIELPSPTIVETPTQSGTMTDQGITISEVMVNPESGQSEWVELYNANNFEVNITDWFLDDIEDGGASPKKITVTIPAKGYETVDVTSLFNNDGDSVRLLNGETTPIDSMSYDSSLQGYTWGKETPESTTYCLQNPTKQRANGSCIEASLTVTPTLIKATPSPTRKPSPTPTLIKIANTPTPQAKPYVLSVQTYPIIPTPSLPQLPSEITPQSSPQPASSSLGFALLSLSYSALSVGSILMKIYQ